MIDQSEGDAAHRRRLGAHLDAMLALCETVECRRCSCSPTSGRRREPCGNCDTCLTPPESWDGTVPAQKLLSTVVRLQRERNQRFGAGPHHRHPARQDDAAHARSTATRALAPAASAPTSASRSGAASCASCSRRACSPCTATATARSSSPTRAPTVLSRRRARCCCAARRRARRKSRQAARRSRSTCPPRPPPSSSGCASGARARRASRACPPTSSSAMPRCAASPSRARPPRRARRRSAASARRSSSSTATRCSRWWRRAAMTVRPSDRTRLHLTDCFSASGAMRTASRAAAMNADPRGRCATSRRSADPRRDATPAFDRIARLADARAGGCGQSTSTAEFLGFTGLAVPRF